MPSTADTPTATDSAKPSLMQTVRRVGKLTAPYFRSDEKWKARGLLVGIVALNLGAVYMLVQINEWYRVFYDALQNKDQAVFWQQIVRFCWLAVVYIVIAVYKFYLTQVLELRWRAWMTDHYLTRWLANKAFYRMELARFTSDAERTPDNPDQRIQEDLNLFTSYTVTLSMGMLNALVTLLSFVGILWSLSGSLDFTAPAFLGGGAWHIPGYMFWAAVLYCGIGSVIAHYIGRPQVGLNFRQQMLEANFRHHMVRVREYSESIALDGGETVERQQLDTRFSAVMGNYLRLIRSQKNLTWFSSFFGQAAIIFPLIVASPRYFSGAIQLGQLMQINSAFGRVQDSLSWLVDNYMSIAIWKATTDRLAGFEESLSAESHINDGFATSASTGAIDARGLTVGLPRGATLLSSADLHVAPGDTVLVHGPSGSGKSSLFRTLAGIWPHARGHVDLPADTMFIPQRPYFPDGALRDALAYPQPAAQFTDEGAARRPAAAVGRPARSRRCLEPEIVGWRAAATRPGPRPAQETRLGAGRRGHQRTRRRRRGHAVRTAGGAGEGARRCARLHRAPLDAGRLPCEALAAPARQRGHRRSLLPDRRRRRHQRTGARQRLNLRVACPPRGAQFAGRARPAAVTPGMPLRAVALVAGVRLLEDEVDQRIAAEPVRHRPGLRLVDPHQRRLDDEPAVEAQRQRELHRLHRVVAAIGVAGIVGLAAITCSPRRYASAPASVRNSRLRPGTKVLGRPSACMAKATSSVRDEPPICESESTFSRWSSPSRGAHAGKRSCNCARTVCRTSISIRWRWPYSKPSVSTRS